MYCFVEWWVDLVWVKRDNSMEWEWNAKEYRADKWMRSGRAMWGSECRMWKSVNYVYAIEATWIIQFEIPNFCLFKTHKSIAQISIQLADLF